MQPAPSNDSDRREGKLSCQLYCTMTGWVLSIRITRDALTKLFIARRICLSSPQRFFSQLLYCEYLVKKRKMKFHEADP